MRRHVFVYLVLMAGVAAFSALMAVDGVAITLAFVTLGLGFPLAFSATLLAYMACLLPAVAALPNWRLSLLAVPLSVALVAGWAMLPNWQSARHAEVAATALAAADIRPSTPVNARTVEFRRPKDFEYRLSGKPLDSDPCPSICRALLLGGEVDWVRMVMEQAESSANRTSVGELDRSRFAVAEGERCAVPGKTAAADARCVVVVADDAAPAEVAVAIRDTMSIKRLRSTSFWYRPVGERIVSVVDRRADAPREILRHTETHFEVILKGSIVGPQIDGLETDGMDFLRMSQPFNRIDMAAILRTVGYELPESALAGPAVKPPRLWSDLPSDEQTLELVSILDLPAATPFSAQQARAVEDWVSSARWYKEEWPPARIELLRRIGRDRRVKEGSSFGQIVENHPEVASALIPDILERVAERTADDKDLDPGYFGALALSKHGSTVLGPHASGILALVAKGGPARDLLLPSVGRLGVDPVPYLQPIGPEPDERRLGSKAYAACLAEDRWSASLIPLLRARVTDQELARSSPQIRSVLDALMRHGDRAFVEQAIARSRWQDRDREWRVLLEKSQRKNLGSWWC